MSNKEKSYKFVDFEGRTGRKKKFISVPESKLSEKQKEQIYQEFLGHFYHIPEELQTRFMKKVITILNEQAQQHEHTGVHNESNG